MDAEVRFFVPKSIEKNMRNYEKFSDKVSVLLLSTDFTIGNEPG